MPPRMPPRLDLIRTAGRGGAHRFRRGAHRRPHDPPGQLRRGSVAALLVLGTAATAAGASGGPPPVDPAGAGHPLGAGPADVLDRYQRGEAQSRSHSRAEPPESPAAPPAGGPAPEAGSKARDKAKDRSEREPRSGSKPPAVPAPIGGLTGPQMAHAATIVRVGQQAGLPRRAYVVALATAMQESTLRVLASDRIPESNNYPHEGHGNDHDSVGLFQQRPSMGWGTVAQCMDPVYSARAFYRALQRVPGWQDLPITLAAQAVQRSAYPYHYAKHEPLARQLVAALTSGGVG